MSDGFAIPVFSTGAIATAKVVLALAGAALATFEIALARAGRADAHRTQRRVAWIALGFAAVGVWTRLAPLRAGTAPHVWELHHHVIGAKYHAELGYTRLYECTLVADVEAGFPIPPADRPIRRLETNRVERADAVLAEATRACRERFDPARWERFAKDVAALRALLPPRQWGSMLTDHGMNASPAWLIAGATLASAAPIGPGMLRALVAVDPLLLAAMTAALVWGFGVRVAALVWIALATFSFADYRWIGGAFLRFDWLALSGIGLALVRRGWLGAGGAALTWATAVRIFPGFLVAAVVLHAGIDLARRRSLALSPAHRRFALGCLAAIAALGALSVAVAGRDAWPAFVENSRKHLATPLLNFAGWKTVVAFDPAQTAAELRDTALPDPYTRWHEAIRDRFERRRPLFWSGLAAFVALLAAALARTPLGSAPALGIGLVLFAGEIGAYYYALIALWATLAERRPEIGVLLLLGCAASIGVENAVSGSADVGAVAGSALALALAVAITWLAGAHSTVTLFARLRG